MIFCFARRKKRVEADHVRRLVATKNIVTKNETSQKIGVGQSPDRNHHREGSIIKIRDDKIDFFLYFVKSR